MNYPQAEATAALLVEMGYPARSYPDRANPGTHYVMVAGGARRYRIDDVASIPADLAALAAGATTNKQGSEGDDGTDTQIPLPVLPD